MPSRHSLLVAVLLLAGPTGAVAQGLPTPGATPTIADSFARADRVVIARILSIEPFPDCGTRYTARIARTFKDAETGTTTSDTVAFGRDAAVEIGTDYLLFLRHVAEPEQARAPVPPEMRPRTTAAVRRAFLQCHGLVPGYEIDTAILGSLAGEQFVLPPSSRHGGKPADLPDASAKADALGQAWIAPRDAMLGYLETLSRR